jgi:hypothetical protein
MQTILFRESEIWFKELNRIQAVFIPFAYCGNADNDIQISYIVFYNHQASIYHINLRGEDFANYKIADNLEEKLNDLPQNLRKELIKHIEENAVKIISQ